MIPLRLRERDAAPPHVLCLGCHSDDIEIGCGGTILRLLAEHPDCTITWVVFSAIGRRGEEAERAALRFVGRANLNALILKSFPDGFMPFVGAEVKETFEELKRQVAPDIILTHQKNDAHQDHRLVAELTWNTFRNHLILEYEIPKYDGDMGRPNLFVPLAPQICETKVDLLNHVFQTQREKPWFRTETFMALMRLRGMECNADSGYAEAFYARKLVL